MGIRYTTIPIGSLALVEDDTLDEYLELYLSLPPAVRGVLNNPKTGSYVRGLIKNYALSSEKAPLCALEIFRIGIGASRLSNLGATLSSTLQIAADKAQQIAQEIEHDLFAPIAGDLNDYLKKKQQQDTRQANRATGKPRQAGATNVLDLKRERSQPKPPDIPRPPRLPRSSNP